MPKYSTSIRTRNLSYQHWREVFPDGFSKDGPKDTPNNRAAAYALKDTKREALRMQTRLEKILEAGEDSRPKASLSLGKLKWHDVSVKGVSLNVEVLIKADFPTLEKLLLGNIEGRSEDSIPPAEAYLAKLTEMGDTRHTIAEQEGPDI